MCDYSLEHYNSRPAQQGETYETRRFPSGSIGFVVPGEASIAICMSCDTRIRLENLPASLVEKLAVGTAALVTFTRLETSTYRDGVRFDNGRAVTLQELGSGVRAMVEDALVSPEPALMPYASRVRQRPELVG